DRRLERLGIVRDRREGRLHVGEQARVDLRHRGDDLRGTTERAEEPTELRVWAGEVRRHRLQVAEEGRQLGDRDVEVLPAARERVAEPDQVVLRGTAGGGIEGVGEVVERGL